MCLCLLNAEEVLFNSLVQNMISELYIEQYRGIKNLSLNNLGKINIIAGANNCGKTSILEIIKSLEAPNDKKTWRFLGRREGNSLRTSITIYDTMKALFPMTSDEDSKSVKYQGIYDNKEFQVELIGKTYDTVITGTEFERLNWDRLFPIDENEYETSAIAIDYYVYGKYCGNDIFYGIQKGFPIKEEKVVEKIVSNVEYISPTQHAQNKFFLASLMTDPKLYEQFVEIMKEFDPGFISINSVEEEKSLGRKYIVLSKGHKEGLLLNAYGDGMKKAMLLLSAVLKAKGGILLLDEFETAIHISAMEKVFHWLLETAVKLNVQIFMTSHSLEAISTVLKCCPELQEDVRMITLIKTEDGMKARNVDARKAVQLVEDYGLELR